jgi:putative SOS response-associated peptidase YedK
MTAGDRFDLERFVTAQAPIHNRQVVVLDRSNWPPWLDLSRPESELLRPLPGLEFGGLLKCFISLGERA